MQSELTALPAAIHDLKQEYEQITIFQINKYIIKMA